jgi:hypothetical protein
LRRQRQQARTITRREPAAPRVNIRGYKDTKQQEILEKRRQRTRKGGRWWCWRRKRWKEEANQCLQREKSRVV